MHHYNRIGVFCLCIFNVLFGYYHMYVAITRPEHKVSAGFFGNKAAKMLVRHKDDFPIGGQ